MEHVLKATKKTLQAGSQLTGLTQEGKLGKHVLDTAESNTTLAESKAHDGDWLEDCKALWRPPSQGIEPFIDLAHDGDMGTH